MGIYCAKEALARFIVQSPIQGFVRKVRKNNDFTGKMDFTGKAAIHKEDLIMLLFFKYLDQQTLLHDPMPALRILSYLNKYPNFSVSLPHYPTVLFEKPHLQ